MKTGHILMFAVLACVVAYPSTASGVRRPPAAWKYEPQKVSAGQSVVFDASESAGRDGTILSYEWDFGDHSRTWTTSPVWNHAYSEPGKYTVTLTVTDRAGSAGVATLALEVTGRAFMITFDDGPASESTPYILEQLRRITGNLKFVADTYDLVVRREDEKRAIAAITAMLTLWAASTRGIGPVYGNG